MLGHFLRRSGSQDSLGITPSPPKGNVVPKLSHQGSRIHVSGRDLYWIYYVYARIDQHRDNGTDCTAVVHEHLDITVVVNKRAETFVEWDTEALDVFGIAQWPVLTAHVVTYGDQLDVPSHGSVDLLKPGYGRPALTLVFGQYLVRIRDHLHGLFQAVEEVAVSDPTTVAHEVCCVGAFLVDALGQPGIQSDTLLLRALPPVRKPISIEKVGLRRHAHRFLPLPDQPVSTLIPLRSEHIGNQKPKATPRAPISLLWPGRL